MLSVACPTLLKVKALSIFCKHCTSTTERPCNCLQMVINGTQVGMVLSEHGSEESFVHVVSSSKAKAVQEMGVDPTST